MKVTEISNGRTGELLQSSGQHDTPPRHKHARALRTVLQQALLKAVDKTNLRLSSRLVEIRELPNKTLSLRFEDEHTDEVDLLIGADGVRSVSFITVIFSFVANLSVQGCPPILLPGPSHQLYRYNSLPGPS